MNALLLEIRILIASFDERVWWIFYCEYDDFRVYSHSPAGIAHCIKSFTRIVRPNLMVLEYRLFGILHRIDGPAVVSDNGEHWYINGLRHRDNDLPAFVCSRQNLNNGIKQSWWRRGKRHREGGLPAVIKFDGTTEYWVDLWNA